MSRLCKLRSKSYGDIGQWAYNEIKSLKEQLESTKAKLLESELHAARLVDVSKKQVPVGYANADELDNMLDDRTATVAGVMDCSRRTALYTRPAITEQGDDSLRRDAARYRWLKNNDSPIGIYHNTDFDDFYYIHDADAAIDAAMEASNENT